MSRGIGRDQLIILTFSLVIVILGLTLVYGGELSPGSAFTTPTPLSVPQVAMAVASFNMIDEAGAYIGDGEVRLFAPERIPVNGSARIRVQVKADAVNPVIPPTLTATPVRGTPQPEPVPSPARDVQYITVREFMGAGLRGDDINYFDVKRAPENGLRYIEPGKDAWWEWNISPIGDQAVKSNRLEVYMYLPLERNDGTAFEQEINVLPFQIQVEMAKMSPAQRIKEGSDWINTVLGVVLTVSGVVGVLVAGFNGRKRVAKWLSRRS
jgi:hypothetical protein